MTDEFTKAVEAALEYADPMHPPEFWRKKKALASIQAAHNQAIREAKLEALHELLNRHAYTGRGFVVLDEYMAELEANR